MPFPVTALFVVAVVCVMLTNALWYHTKFLLRSRGYPTSYFRNHFRDLGQLSQLIRDEKDDLNRRRYSRLRIVLCTSIVLTFSAFIVLGKAFLGAHHMKTEHISAPAKP